MPLLGKQSQKGNSFVNPFFKQGIGRRTGVVIKTDVRKDSDGFEVFDDYFSDSDLENSELSFALNKENISVPNGGRSGQKGKGKSQDKIKRSSPLRPMKSFSPMVSSGKSSIDASKETEKTKRSLSKDGAVTDDEKPSTGPEVTATAEDIKFREERCDTEQHHETESAIADEEVADKMIEVVEATSERNTENDQHPGEEKMEEEKRQETVLKTLNDGKKISASPSQTQIFPLTKKRLSFSCAEKDSSSPEPLLQSKPIGYLEEKDKEIGEVHGGTETSYFDALHRASGAAAFSFRFSELLSSTKNPENSQCTESEDADIVIVSEGSEKSFIDKSKGRKSGAHYRKETNTNKKVKTDSKKQKSGRGTLDVDKSERRQDTMDENKESGLNNTKHNANRNVSVAVVEVHAPMNLLDDEEELSSSASETIKDDGVVNIGDETDDIVKIQYKLVDQSNDESKERKNKTLSKIGEKTTRKRGRKEDEENNLNVSNTGRRDGIKTTKRKMKSEGPGVKDHSEEKQEMEEEDEVASIPHKDQQNEDQIITSAVAGKRRSKRLRAQHNSDISVISRDGKTDIAEGPGGSRDVHLEQDPKVVRQDLVSSSQSSDDNSQIDGRTRRGRSRKTKRAMKSNKIIDEAKTRIPVPSKSKRNAAVRSNEENTEDGLVGRSEVEKQSDGDVPVTDQTRTKMSKVASQSESEDHLTTDDTAKNQNQSNKGHASPEDMSILETDGAVMNRGKRDKKSTSESSLSNDGTSNNLNQKKRRASTRTYKKRSVAKSQSDSEDHLTKDDTAKNENQLRKGQASSEDMSILETDGAVMNRGKRDKKSTSESSLSNDGTSNNLNQKKRRASTRTNKKRSVAKSQSDSEDHLTKDDTAKNENQSCKGQASSEDMSNQETDGTSMNRGKRERRSTSESSLSYDGTINNLNQKKRRASMRTNKKTSVSSAVAEEERLHVEACQNVQSTSSSDETSNVTYDRMFTLPALEEENENMEEDKEGENSNESQQKSRESTELHSTKVKVKRGDSRGKVERMSVVKKTLDYLDGESRERIEPGKTLDAAVDQPEEEEITEGEDSSSHKNNVEETTPVAPEKTTNSQTERGLCSPLSILKSSKVVKKHRKNMKKKKFRFSIQEVPLSKAWIIPPTRENESNRRSKRNRVRPLEFWRNERAIYERRKSGGFALKGICSPEIEEPYLRKKKTHKRRSKGKYTIPITPKNLSLHLQAPEEAMTGCSDPVPVVNPETQREVLVDVVRTPSSNLYVGPSGSAPTKTDNILIAKQLVQPAFNAGALLIRPESEKGLQISQRDTMVFYIVRGKLAVTIHKTTQVLESGSFFFVPPGNVYNISNLRKDEAKVVFFQHKGPPMDGYSP